MTTNPLEETKHGIRALTPRYESLAEQIAADVTTLIQSGELKGGSVIAEIALAEQLGTSRSPVREALSILAADGLIQRPARKSAYVTELTKSDCRNLYDTRALVDGYVTFEAVLSCPPETIDTLRELVARMRNSVGSTSKYRAELEHFQLAVYDACPNTIASEVARSLWRRSLPYRSLSMVEATADIQIRHSFDVHKRLLRFFEEGDGHGARTLMSDALRDHCREVLMELDLD